MDLTSIKYFLYRKDVKIILISTITGAIFQILSKRYIQRHPEFFKEAPKPNQNQRFPRLVRFRGGYIEIAGFSIKIGQVVVIIIIKVIAEKGVIIAFLGSSGIVFVTLHAKQVSKYLQNALPQNLAYLEEKKYILIGNEKVYFDQSDHNLQYLLRMLKDHNIPFHEKQKIANLILKKYLNIKDICIILCIVLILYMLYIQSTSGYYILLQNMIEEIKNGKILKPIGRYILRQLKKKAINIDPQFIEVVNL